MSVRTILIPSNERGRVSRPRGPASPQSGRIFLALNSLVLASSAFYLKKQTNKGAAFAHIVPVPTILIFFNQRRCQAIPIAIVYANWNWNLNMGVLGMHFLPMILHHLLAVADPLHSKAQ